MINKKSKIYIAGHNGLVGSAILRKLKTKGFKNIFIKDRKDLDLNNKNKVLAFLKKIKPNFIFIAAAKVGGVYANNTLKAEFIYHNLNILSFRKVILYRCCRVEWIRVVLMERKLPRNSQFIS